MYANVIIDISHEKLDKTFQYKVPQELREKLAVGMQVEVPFGNGNRRNTGYVVELTDEPEYDITKLKEIVGKYADNMTDSDVKKLITLFDIAIDQKKFVICFGI